MRLRGLDPIGGFPRRQLLWGCALIRVYCAALGDVNGVGKATYRILWVVRELRVRRRGYHCPRCPY